MPSPIPVTRFVFFSSTHKKKTLSKKEVRKTYMRIISLNNKGKQTKEPAAAFCSGHTGYRSFFDSLDDVDVLLQLAVLVLVIGHELPSPERPLNGHLDAPIAPHDWRQQEYHKPTPSPPQMKSNSLQHIRILTTSAKASTFHTMLQQPPPPQIDDRLPMYPHH